MRFKPPPADPIKQKKEEQRRLRRAALIPVAIAMPLVLGIAAFTFFQKETQQPLPRPTSGELALMGGMPGMGLELMPGMPIGPSFTDDPRPANATGLMLLHPGDDPFDTEPADLAPMSGSGVQRLAGVIRDAEGIAEQTVFWTVAAPPEQVLAHYKAEAEKAGFRLILNKASKPIPRTPPSPTTQPTTQPAAMAAALAAPLASATQPAKPVPPATMQIWFRESAPMPVNPNSSKSADQNLATPHGAPTAAATPAESAAPKLVPQCLLIRTAPQNDGSVRVLLWLRYPSNSTRITRNAR